MEGISSDQTVGKAGGGLADGQGAGRIQRDRGLGGLCFFRISGIGIGGIGRIRAFRLRGGGGLGRVAGFRGLRRLGGRRRIGGLRLGRCGDHHILLIGVEDADADILGILAYGEDVAASGGGGTACNLECCVHGIAFYTCIGLGNVVFAVRQLGNGDAAGGLALFDGDACVLDQFTLCGVNGEAEGFGHIQTGDGLTDEDAAGGIGELFVGIQDLHSLGAGILAQFHSGAAIGRGSAVYKIRGGYGIAVGGSIPLHHIILAVGNIGDGCGGVGGVCADCGAQGIVELAVGSVDIKEEGLGFAFGQGKTAQGLLYGQGSGGAGIALAVAQSKVQTGAADHAALLPLGAASAQTGAVIVAGPVVERGREGDGDADIPAVIGSDGDGLGQFYGVVNRCVDGSYREIAGDPELRNAGRAGAAGIAAQGVAVAAGAADHETVGIDIRRLHGVAQVFIEHTVDHDISGQLDADIHMVHAAGGGGLVIVVITPIGPSGGQRIYRAQIHQDRKDHQQG